MFCEYSKIFGTPGEGVHSYRIGGVAIVDVLLTILLAYGISYTTKYNFVPVLIFTFILGIIAHRLFCVHTTVDKLIFGE